MDIFLPFTEIQPLTRACLRRYNYSAVKLLDDKSYSRFFQERWEAEEDFINVEHDVIFWQGAIEQLESCSEIWCTFLRENDHYSTTPTLCLARFKSTLLKNNKVDWEKQLTESNLWYESGLVPWQYCDVWIYRSLGEQGLRPHYHAPPVINANSTLLEYYDFPTNVQFEENSGNFYHHKELTL